MKRRHRLVRQHVQNARVPNPPVIQDRDHVLMTICPTDCERVCALASLEVR